jgi:L-methionine (R)-S-oxide reductase
MKPVATMVDEILRDASSEGTRLQRICDLLRREVPRFSWVGFYLAYEEAGELLLGPFSGSPTEHTTIPYGRGICGQVAESRKLFVVEDVCAEENYLACTVSTKSEIVVPIFLDGAFLGELDIDSQVSGPFEDGEPSLLQDLASRVAPLVQAIVPKA